MLYTVSISADLLSRPLRRTRDQDQDLGDLVSIPRPRPWPPGLETKTKTLATRSRYQDQDLGARSRDQDQDLSLQVSSELEFETLGLEITSQEFSHPPQLLGAYEPPKSTPMVPVITNIISISFATGNFPMAFMYCFVTTL